MKKIREKIHFLRRNTTSGEILKKYSEKEDHYIFIDPMGGHFSNNEKNRNNYMQIRNMVLDFHIHLGYVIKKDLFKDKGHNGGRQ